MNILKNKEKNYKYLLIVIFVFNIIYFFYGFINQHDFSNGGKIDFDHIYNNFLLFKNNSLSEINWKNYESSSLPLHYLTTKYFIPLNNIYAFKLYTFLISLLCIIPLYQILKLKTHTFNLNINFLFLSSLILISSSFRTDAFFGLEENIGYLLFLLTFLIYLYYLEKKNNYYLFFLILIASLTFYTRQTYAFVSIIIYLATINTNQLLSKKNFAITFLFIIFLLPSLYFFYNWGSLMPTEAAERLVPFNYNNIAIIFGMFVIFNIPFFINELIKNRTNIISSKNIGKLILIPIFFIIYAYTFWNIPYSDFGGGPLYKIYLNFSTFKPLYLFFSFLGLISTIYFSFKNYRLSIFFIFFIFIYCFADNLFFSYLDPLMLLSLLIFHDRIIFDLKKNIIYSLSVYMYFLTLHLSWIYYFHIIIGDTVR